MTEANDILFFYTLLFLLPIIFIWTLRSAKKVRESSVKEWELLGSVQKSPRKGVDYKININGISFDFYTSNISRKRGVTSDASIAYYFLPFNTSSQLDIIIQHPLHRFFGEDFTIGNPEVDGHYCFRKLNENDRRILQTPAAHTQLLKLKNDRKFWELTLTGPAFEPENDEVRELVKGRTGALLERFSNSSIALYDHKEFLVSIEAVLELGKLGF